MLHCWLHCRPVPMQWKHWHSLFPMPYCHKKQYLCHRLWWLCNLFLLLCHCRHTSRYPPEAAQEWAVHFQTSHHHCQALWQPWQSGLPQYCCPVPFPQWLLCWWDHCDRCFCLPAQIPHPKIQQTIREWWSIPVLCGLFSSAQYTWQGQPVQYKCLQPKRSQPWNFQLQKGSCLRHNEADWRFPPLHFLLLYHTDHCKVLPAHLSAGAYWQKVPDPKQNDASVHIRCHKAWEKSKAYHLPPISQTLFLRKSPQRSKVQTKTKLYRQVRKCRWHSGYRSEKHLQNPNRKELSVPAHLCPAQEVRHYPPSFSGPFSEHLPV